MKAALLFMVAGLSFAQWLDYKEPGVPRLRDGRVNLNAPAPRIGGKPDLSGVWLHVPTPRAELVKLFGEEAFILDVPGDSLESFSKYAINALADYPIDGGPLTPEGAKLYLARLQSFSKDNPTGYCMPAGVPVGQLLFMPFKIVQAARQVTILNEADSTFRQIYLDGRPLPKDPQPSWQGYSVAKWQGSTLVVETIGFNDKSWIDLIGHPRSEGMRITERYTRRDFGHMDVEIGFEDAKYYTKPFSYKVEMRLLPDTDVLEGICENERDMSHMR